MSELGFTGKIPIPNLKQVGDLSGEISRQQQLQMRSDALEQRRRAAQAKQAQQTRVNEASVKAEMGGLFKDAHPFALPFLNEGAEMLERDLMPFMALENGAELAKPLIKNFKTSVERYTINRDMVSRESDLTSMIDPNSSVALAENESLGDFYNAVSSPEILQAAQDFQYRNLMQNAKLEYKNGRVDIVGQVYSPKTGVSPTVTELSLHPSFNSENTFDPQTQMVSPLSLVDFGHDIREIEKGSDRNWSAERISSVGKEGGYGNYYQGFLNFNSSKGSTPYNWRMRAFLDNEDHFKKVNNSAARMSQQELFKFFQLNPADRDAHPTLYESAKLILNESWDVSLNHSKYPDDEGGMSTAQKAQSMLATATVASVKETQLPSDPSQQGLYAPIQMEAEKDTIDRVAFEVTNLSAKTMENLVAPSYDEEFYRQAKFYVSQNLIAYDDRGRPIRGPLLGENDSQLEGVQDFLAKGRAQKKSTIQNVVFYKNNPDIMGVITTDGSTISIDTKKLNAYTQPIFTAVKGGLQKETGLTVEKLYEHAYKEFFVGEGDEEKLFD